MTYAIDLVKTILTALAPAVQQGLVRVAQNLETHPDPEGAVELAILCTSARAGSLAIINAALRLRKKLKK